ncbi:MULTISPECIES: AmmeMemoRadiSam system radical SAM enzyme [Mesotoga]|jgi:pyruvate formate lyase activating enzyme|uniref:Pyruvate-formate lyase-activating enzyme n=1 Tax=Mesotoga prima MesG1.Ag.4.2 TaxID=660470 RepID=I2F2Z6_9BACT|nr:MULTISPECIES: AmmeMemoRadiSam system radical SAM enzyme [Mesotoga]MCP5456570.1 AmmeMemoRadiSam system radical SAM enzyme [Thermotogota bacterium]CCU85836.1 Radical SAM domain protein [Mesotoga infera]AFK06299.1 pyruvate-formate lyase-activating enzyme [Mesotoga prima MesG1.Ag.4.2]MCP5460526.1 AmmeMemoRadiSam system radical SAM enzyme [Thermotogota bacterium]MDK2943307.1 pyruvate formate lyase activating enzyme [Mesotoga sp.]
MKPAVYFDEYGEEKVLQCLLCPLHCIIKPDQVGFCGVRKNVDGMLYSLNYGQLTSIAIDPIEKKPLYHLFPGEKILSVGSWGCNLRCNFCQNWEISKQRPKTVMRVMPQQLIQIALERESRGIAFTYNEPIVSFEFILDTSRAAAKEGIYSILVTNGVIDEEPMDLLSQSVRGMNIDLKGWNDEFYVKDIGTEKRVVLRSIETARKAGTHIELTTLIIPGKNDSPEEMREEAKWISGLSKDIPLHINRYFPNYKSTIPPTSPDSLIQLAEVAKEYLRYVYVGNIDLPGLSDTTCPYCGNLLVERRGMRSSVVGIDEKGRCNNCQKEIPIVF